MNNKQIDSSEIRNISTGISQKFKESYKIIFEKVNETETIFSDIKNLVDFLSEYNEKLHFELEEKDKELTELTKKYKLAQSTLKDQEEKLKEFDEFNLKTNEVCLLLKNVYQTENDLNSKKEQFNNKVKIFNEIKEKIESENARLQRESENYFRNLTEITQERDCLNDKNKELKTLVSKLENEKDLLNSQINKLETEKVLLNSQLNKLKTLFQQKANKTEANTEKNSIEDLPATKIKKENICNTKNESTSNPEPNTENSKTVEKVQKNRLDDDRFKED